MGTLEFMEKELSRHKLNLERQIERNAPAEDIAHIKKKVKHYTEVCNLLNKANTFREKCLEHQDFHKGEDGVFKGWISVEDLDYIISEVSG
jgi:hypothetical protein